MEDAISSYLLVNQLMPAPRPLSCQHKRSAILDVVPFRTVVVPSTGVIPSPFHSLDRNDMNRATRSEQGSLCRLERLLCAAFLLNQPSSRRPSSGLSRSRAYACAVTSNSWPCARGPSQSKRLPATRSSCNSGGAVPPATSTHKSALYPEEPRTLVLRTIVPRSPHVSRPFRELQP